MAGASDNVIQFRCECGNPISVSKELAGRRAKCNQCGRAMIIPAASPAIPTPPGPPPAVPLPIPAASPMQAIVTPVAQTVVPMAMAHQVNVNVAMTTPIPSQEQTLWEGKPSLWYHGPGFVSPVIWAILWSVLAVFAKGLAAWGVAKAVAAFPNLKSVVAAPYMEWAFLPILLLAVYKVLKNIWVLVRRILAYQNTHYIFTTQRVRVRLGVFSREFVQMELFRLKDIAVVQSLWGRLFKYAHVRLISTDPLINDVALMGVPDGPQMAETLRLTAQQSRAQSGVMMIHE